MEGGFLAPPVSRVIPTPAAARRGRRRRAHVLTESKNVAPSRPSPPITTGTASRLQTLLDPSATESEWQQGEWIGPDRVRLGTLLQNRPQVSDLAWGGTFTVYRTAGDAPLVFSMAAPAPYVDRPVDIPKDMERWVDRPMREREYHSQTRCFLKQVAIQAEIFQRRGGSAPDRALLERFDKNVLWWAVQNTDLLSLSAITLPSRSSASPMHMS